MQALKLLESFKLKEKKINEKTIKEKMRLYNAD